MKKHWLALILPLTVLSLCACGMNTPTGTTEGAPPETASAAETTAMSETGTEPLTETPTETPTAAVPEQEAYFRPALSWKGADGAQLSYRTERVQPDPDVLVYFDKVTFTGSFSGLDKINAAIGSDCDAFIQENYARITEILADFEKDGTLDEDPGYRNLCSYTELKDAYTDGRYLSVHYYFEWWGGGVTNTSAYGLNFDLVTGDVITLADYYGGCDPETLRMNILKSAAADLADDLMDFSYIDKPLEEINFYFYNGTVAINFGPYEIGWGGWSRTNEYPIARFRTNDTIYAE